MLVPQYSIRRTPHGLLFICLVRQDVSTVVLGTDNSSQVVLPLFSGLVRQYCCTKCEQLITACSTFVQCPCTLASQYSVQTLTTASLFAQYVSTVVLGTDSSSLLVLNLSSVLVNQQCSTWYRKLITACSSFVQCLSTLVPQYAVETLTVACLFAQYVSTVVLDTDNSTQLVLHLFSVLVGQYCSKWYSQLITACSLSLQCTCRLVLQYLVHTTHHGLFFIFFSVLVRKYCST